MWVGIDIGKAHHCAVATDEAGRQVWSRKIANDEAEVLDAIAVALDLA